MIERVETIHESDPLIGRQWDLTCFVCREVSYIGPSFGCVEAFGDVVVCARCRSANRPLPAERVARIHSGPVLSSLHNDQLTWIPYPLMDEYEHADPTTIMCRLARAGLDAHARTFYDSLPHLQRESICTISLMEAAIVADRDELLAWILDNVAVNIFGDRLLTLLYDAYEEIAVRCITLLRARCSLPIRSKEALLRLSLNNDIPLALFEKLFEQSLLDSNNIADRDFHRILTNMLESFGNDAIVRKLLEHGTSPCLVSLNYDGCIRCSFSARTYISTLNESDRIWLENSLIYTAMVCLPPDVALLHELLDGKKLDDQSKWFA